MTQHPHFTRLLELLRQEKDEDRRQYLETVRQKPLSERVDQGYAWYPLNVVQTGFSLGEKAFVIVERTTNLNEPHQLKAGASVSLFTNALSPSGERPEEADKSGIINFVERNRMKIVLNARDVPEWLHLGQLGVDLLFDERSYVEMEKALNQVMKAKGSRLAELRDLLAPWSAKSARQPAFDKIKTGEDHHSPAAGWLEALNSSQRAAVHRIEAAREVAAIHGPPGTGKTTTVVAAIRHLSERENTILVTAPSNTAADLLTERLAAAGLEVVRIGNISRVDEAIVPHTLEGILSRHPESKMIRKVKLQAAEYRRQSQRHKRVFTREDRREREHLKSQARELEQWAITLEDRLIDQILTAADAITCTLVGAANPVLDRYKFRTCVIDEAAQALEPATWIPIIKSSRVILAGDPYQLPPTVKNIDAARGGLSKTLIERCLEMFPDSVNLLTVQYRMHQAIMGFSNQYFYGGALEAHDTVAQRRLSPLAASPGSDDAYERAAAPPFDPVVFIDTAGTGFEEKTGDGSSARSRSRYNPEEALLLREHLVQLIEQFSASFGECREEATVADNFPSIGILSPYREQVNYLDGLLREEARFAALMTSASADIPKKLVVNTIDGFQGQERDVVYISLVRSNAKSEIGFLSDFRRMNVAMTRARMLLVVLGDSATIGNNPFYKSFLDYCAEHGQWQSAWEYLK